ncbi:MAG: HD domain-containing protein [Candidatus Poribacteria bacterium]|nr:HD domain-containing protein [Candidatus Poribacteria bacterium]
MPVTDVLRAKVRAELPEVEEITNPELHEKVIEAWATALDGSSFGAISEIRPSGNPDTPPLKRGTQTDHIRGVTRLAMRISDELTEMFPELKVDRDLLIACALCHDVGKPWEFDPENQARWRGSPRAAGRPSIRHPAYGVHICLTVGLPEEVAHVAGAHSGEGELIVRSLENTIVHHADYAFWRVLDAGGLLDHADKG